MTFRQAIRCLALAACAFCATAGAEQWTWELTRDQVKGLNAFERAQYLKAAELFRDENYKAAAAEFEKMKVQFPDSPALPYAIFMQARSQHGADVRNQAVKTYQEVLDYFADDVWVAAPALYFMGVAHFDNGDTAKGLAAMKKLVADGDYAVEPVAAGAFRRLGDAYHGQGEDPKAVEHWKKAAAFYDVNRDDALAGRNAATEYYLATGNFAGYWAWRPGQEADEASVRSAVLVAGDRADEAFDPSNDYFRGKNEEVRTKAAAAFHKWYRSRKSAFVTTDEKWEYYAKWLWFMRLRYRDRAELELVASEVLEVLEGEPGHREHDERLAWAAARMRETGLYDLAGMLLDRMTNRARAAYEEHHIMAAQDKWAEAADRLRDVENMGDEDWARRAVNSRAWIYKERLRKYDEAIDLYQQIDNPPSTLWDIQTCHYRAGRNKQAMAVLTEIENMFPAEAARAAWQKTYYLHKAGDKKLAVAGARRILKVYKKDAVASDAHRLLEEYGVATGGGVFHEE